jgi:hypothetical protein
MHILIDLDGTIATINEPHFIRLVNTGLSLGVPDERLQALSLRDFLSEPEVVAAQQRYGGERFKTLFTFLHCSQDAIAARFVVDGAQAALTSLTQLGSIAYCTARKGRYSGTNEKKRSAMDTLNEKMLHASRDWLSLHHFPFSDHIMCCVGVVGKLAAIVTLIRSSGEPVMLVDDAYAQIVAASENLSSEDQALLAGYFTLYAFGASVAPPSSSFSVVALPTWADLDQALLQVPWQDERTKPAWIA